MVVSRRVLESFLGLLHCLPLACGRRGSLREDEPVKLSQSCVLPSRLLVVVDPVGGVSVCARGRC